MVTPVLVCLCLLRQLELLNMNKAQEWHSAYGIQIPAQRILPTYLCTRNMSSILLSRIPCFPPSQSLRKGIHKSKPCSSERTYDPESQLAGLPQAIARVTGRTSPGAPLKNWGEERPRPARVDTPSPKLCPNIASIKQRTQHKIIPVPICRRPPSPTTDGPYNTSTDTSASIGSEPLRRPTAAAVHQISNYYHQI